MTSGRKSDHAVEPGRSDRQKMTSQARDYVYATAPLARGLVSIHEAYEKALNETHSTWRPNSPAARDVLFDHDEMTRAYE